QPVVGGGGRIVGGARIVGRRLLVVSSAEPGSCLFGAQDPHTLGGGRGRTLVVVEVAHVVLTSVTLDVVPPMSPANLNGPAPTRSGSGIRRTSNLEELLLLVAGHRVDLADDVVRQLLELLLDPVEF